MAEQPQKTVVKFEATSPEEKEAELFQLLIESFSEENRGSRSLPEEVKFLAQGKRDNIECKQIGMDDGFINYIYRITDVQQKKSVVIKWTRKVPRMAEGMEIEVVTEEDRKNLDPENRPKQTRNTDECRTLQRFEGIVSGSTPKVYWMDDKRYFFIMEDLINHVTFRTLLDKGDVSVELFQKMAKLLSEIHRSTHIKTLSGEKWKALVDEFKMNVDIHQRMAIMFYDTAFTAKSIKIGGSFKRVYSPSMEKILPDILDNAEIDKVMKVLRESFLDTHVCLVHNDTHPGGFMINTTDNDLRLLDMETAGVGNPAKEVGYTLGEVICFYYVHQARGNVDVCERIKVCFRTMIADYMRRMGDLITDKGKFINYVAGHAAHFAALRTLASFIAFPPFAELEEAEARCLSVSTAILRQMKDIDTLDKLEKHAFT